MLPARFGVARRFVVAVRATAHDVPAPTDD
jgi:hypothetical protein